MSANVEKLLVKTPGKENAETKYNRHYVWG